MTKLFGSLFALLAMGLAGCSTLNCGDPHPYLTSVAGPPLKAPPGLSVPPPDPAYAINGIGANPGNQSAQAKAGTCLVNPPQLISTQPQVVPKPSTPPKSGPVNTLPENVQPTAKPANKNATPAPTVSTATPPAVAAAARME